MTATAVNSDESTLNSCIKRDSCVVCGVQGLKEAFTVAQVPVYMGCVKSPRGEDVLLDQEWGECESCGAVQLRTLAPLDLVYLVQHNAALGGMWTRHHAAFSDFIVRSKPTKVTEIGGANGSLAKAYIEAHEVDVWTVVEPNPTFSAEGKIKLIEAFIEDVPQSVKEADAIVHSHLFEHLYRPAELLDSVRAQMELGAVMIFSVPNIPALLNASGSNALNFEHTYYFEISTLIWMLKRHGFELRALELFENHSVFIKAVASSASEELDSPPKVVEGPLRFKKFVQATREDVKSLVKKAQSFEGTVYLFGGHVFSQFLIANGFNQELAVGVLDNDVAKQGLRLYGTDLKVLSPEVIRDDQRSAVIVRASQYNAEIASQLRGISDRVEIW